MSQAKRKSVTWSATPSLTSVISTRAGEHRPSIISPPPPPLQISSESSVGNASPLPPDNLGTLNDAPIVDTTQQWEGNDKVTDVPAQPPYSAGTKRRSVGFASPSPSCVSERTTQGHGQRRSLVSPPPSLSPKGSGTAVRTRGSRASISTQPPVSAHRGSVGMQPSGASASRASVGRQLPLTGSPRGSVVSQLSGSRPKIRGSQDVSKLPEVASQEGRIHSPRSRTIQLLDDDDKSSGPITKMKAMVHTKPGTSSKPSSSSSPRAPPKSAGRKKGLALAHRPGPSQKQVIPKAFKEPHPFHEVTDPITGKKILAPEGYTMRPIVPAKKYDVVHMAKAMNDDFAPRVKKLFDPEREAAIAAQQTGVYIGWRCPEFKHDCQRVGMMSKCFCGHLLGEHKKYTGKSIQVPCAQAGCKCRAFQWIPSRPEEVGEFWFQRRRNFDPSQWRAKCRCKHPHDEHDPVIKRCRNRGCGCGHFTSNFLCAACDRHWEDHQTFFETEDMRKKAGLPYGEAYLPFAEMPDLRNAVLTGDEYDDSVYLALTQGQGAIPDNTRTDNNMIVPYNQSPQGSYSGSRSGFRPVYD